MTLHFYRTVSKLLHAGYPWPPAAKEAALDTADAAAAAVPSGLAAAAARNRQKAPPAVPLSAFSDNFARSAVGEAVTHQVESGARQVEASFAGQGKDYTAASSAAAALPAVSLAVITLPEATVHRQPICSPVPAGKDLVYAVPAHPGLASSSLPASKGRDPGLAPQESLPFNLSQAARDSEGSGQSSMEASSVNPELAGFAGAAVPAPAQQPSSLLKPVPATVSPPSFLYACHWLTLAFIQGHHVSFCCAQTHLMPADSGFAFAVCPEKAMLKHCCCSHGELMRGNLRIVIASHFDLFILQGTGLVGTTNPLLRRPVGKPSPFLSHHSKAGVVPGTEGAQPPTAPWEIKASSFVTLSSLSRRYVSTPGADS